MTHALDISHFTQSVGGDLTPEKIERLIARGVERFVVSIADKQIARQQIAALKPYGFEIQTYRYYYWSTMRSRVQEDIAFVEELRSSGVNVQMFWLDFEDTSERRPVAANEADIAWMIEAWVGVCRTGIYTAAWWWMDYMANSTRFSYMPLWFAHWNWEETLDLTIPFGGWTRGEMKQTGGDVWVEGVWCDTNYYEKAAIVPPPVLPPAPEPSQKEIALAAIEEARRAVEAIP